MSSIHVPKTSGGELDSHVVHVEAEQARESALSAYRNDLADFETLVRARALSLETELELLRLRAASFESRAAILYLAGEQS